MFKPTTLALGIAITAIALLAPPAWGQRVQPVSPDPSATVPPSLPNTAPGGAPGYLPAPTNIYASPYPSTGAPVYGPPGSTFDPQPPVVTFEGGQPPPQWDPYAPPGSQQPTILPEDPFLHAPGGPTQPNDWWTRMTRVRQEVRFEYVWMPGDGPEEFGIHDFDLHGTFALPFLANPKTPLLLTPGFGFHLWNGPVSPTADMPPRAFDAYLRTEWNPELGGALSGELSFTIGVHSDFSRVVNESLRYRGKGLAVVALSPNVTLKFGVWYLDRVRVKILPAGGLVWIPGGNRDVRLELLFPNPKIAMRLATDPWNTEWWFYVRGEYGGGSWTVKRRIDADMDGVPDVPEFLDEVDYNDLRVALGFEFDSYNRFDGLLEVGLAFERELYYRSATPVFHANPTVFLGGQLAF